MTTQVDDQEKHKLINSPGPSLWLPLSHLIALLVCSLLWVGVEDHGSRRGLIAGIFTFSMFFVGIAAMLGVLMVLIRLCLRDYGVNPNLHGSIAWLVVGLAYASIIGYWVVVQ